MPAQNNYLTFQDLKILLIDDDIDLLNSIRYFFEDLSAKVIISTNGQEGISLFRQENPDIVLVDLNMPGVDGLKVITIIHENNPEIPLIVVSGTGVVNEAIRAIKLGAWDFVTKPIINFEELELTVLRALEKANLLKENREYKLHLENLVSKRTEQLMETLEELKKAKEKTEESDRLKTEFLNQISHEIRTPLNAIITYSNMIRMFASEEVRSELDKNFDIIAKANNRLIRTIEMMLLLSELNAKTFKFKFEDVEICKLIKEVFEQTKANYPTIDYGTVCNVGDEQLIARLDKKAFKIILENIIDNAFKFTKKGSVTVSTQMSGGVILVVVDDTGVGISEEYFENLFKPFTQEDQSILRRFEGNGLGLAIVRKLCNRMNMIVEIASQKDKWTKVSLRIKC